MNVNTDFKQKESKRVEACRKKRVASMSAQEKLEYKRKANERKRKSRELKRRNLESSSTPGSSSPSENISPATRAPNSFKRPQSFGKAINKSFRALPSSPNKRRCVVAGLAKRVGLKLGEEMDGAMGPGGRPQLADEVVNSIVNFFYRPDISYTMPGMKDEMTVWEEGKKVKLRKFYLVMFLREAYQLYVSSAGECERVKFSKFCELRPKNVLLMKQTPADQCKCKIHENLFLKLKSLKIPYTTFWEDVLCDTTMNSLCWQGECEDCENGKLIKLSMDPGAMIQWWEWETCIKESEKRSEANQNQDVNTTPNKVYKKLECRLKEGCAGEVLQQLIDDWSVILTHVNTKRIQAEEFENDKKSENKRVLQIDFAMNYSCEYQSEIQSALWSRASVTLFTAAAITKDSCQSYLICSDTREKDKDTVAAFLFALYEGHLFPNDEIDEEIIWSDGPTSEFKNKFTMKLLHQLSVMFKKKFTWKFSATSHGKGVVDGIGGRAKSLVRQKVMSQSSERTIVQSPKDFADTARILMPKTTGALHPRK
jgi:hypothetical protein